MCGIVGIVNKNHDIKIDENVLLLMRDSMFHRGPDDKGIYISGAVGLAHRRLSIVGLSTGHQPMSDSSQKIWIVFNGEIYNYPQLKKELRAKGHEFSTESDTEVILHLYTEYGKDCVHYLNGMFAFAIWDKNKKLLFIARDRLGVKPLYYAETFKSILFASEIKSLLHFPEFDRMCNLDSVCEYFLFRSLAGENTLFKGVKSLLPGHHMTIKEGTFKIEQYWNSHSIPIDFQVTINEAKDRLEDLLSDAVLLRLMSDVPLGTFCSGGVDSSLITALAVKNTGKDINTFSVGFHEEEFDESYYAKMVSKKYHTTHHELKISNYEFTQILPELIRLNDEPLHFSNSVHIYAISKLAKEFVTVVLTGEGADELFLGYPRFQLPRIIQNLKRLNWLSTPLLKLANTLKNDHRLNKLLYYLNANMRDVMLYNSATSSLEIATSVLSDVIPIKMETRYQLLDGIQDINDLLSCMSLQDQKSYLVALLNRQDKMSMGASIESRVPFLDYRIVEFANSLPSNIRMKGYNCKMLVKKVAENYLPSEVIYRRKCGFGVPLTAWFRDPKGLGGLAERVINSDSYLEFLNRKRLKQIFQEHVAGQRDHAEILWTAINFLLWTEQYAL